MKKIFTSLMTVSFAVVSFGQITTLGETANSSQTAVGTDGISQVIVSQPDDLNNGIVADYFVDLGAGVYCADDFDMPFDGRLTKVSAFGFNNGANFMTDASAVRVYIMEDDNGGWVPNSSDPETESLYSFDVPIGNPALTIDNASRLYITLDFDVLGENVALANGEKYWLSITPVMDNTGGDGSLRWNWLMSSTQDFPGEALLIDPGDLFGAGYTDWTSIQGLGLPSPNLAMSIEGTETMGVSDVNTKASFMVYPNPATNFVKVKLDGASVKEMTVFSMDGKKVATAANDTVRVTNLPAGVYVVKVVDTNGNTHTSKVVKK